MSERPASSGGQRVEHFVIAAAFAATIVLGIALTMAARSGLAPYASPTFVLVAGALAVTFVAFQFWGFEFQWRGHWLTANMDETVIFLAVLYLPGPAVLLLVPLAEAVVDIVAGRPRIKGIFNVAQITLATAAAWDVFVVVRALLPAPAMTLVAAALAVPVYVAISNLLVSGVFARLEGEATLRVYVQRFVPTAVLLSTMGIAGGLAVYALANVHVLALLALVPVVYVLKRNAALVTRADRELKVHRQLADASASLVGAFQLDPVADFVLEHVGKTLPVGSATLKLSAHGSQAETRVWTRAYEGGVAPGSASLTVDLPGPAKTVLGKLRVEARPGQVALGEPERALLQVIAGQAAAAFLHARAGLALEAAHQEALAQHDRLARQEKLSSLGALIANVAHEIGNPLSYMRLSLATAATQAEKLAAHPDPAVRAPAEKLHASIATARKGADNVVSISNSLRAVARQGPAGHKPLDVNGVARDVASVVRVGYSKDVVIELDLAPEPLMVDGNGGELTQIVLNLAKNAAEAIGERAGHVRLVTRVVQGRAQIAVEDDGPGIPPDVLPQLFRPFFTTKTDGTGIGLNVSRAIAKAHGGDVTCRTEVGRGTRFVLDLPLLAAPRIDRNESHPPPVENRAD